MVIALVRVIVAENYLRFGWCECAAQREDEASAIAEEFRRELQSGEGHGSRGTIANFQPIRSAARFVLKSSRVVGENFGDLHLHRVGGETHAVKRDGFTDACEHGFIRHQVFIFQIFGGVVDNPRPALVAVFLRQLSQVGLNQRQNFLGMREQIF